MGRVFANVCVSQPRTARRNASPEEVKNRLTGREIQAVDRHGKFLVAPLDDGYTMVAHLGMSGRFAIAAPGDKRPPHTHLVAGLDDGRELRFIDPRTFGFVAAFDEDELGDAGLSRLGRDAWKDLPDPAWTCTVLRQRRAPIKALLLDQTILAGLGNIYADEALYQASIHPLSPGGELSPDQVSALLEGVRRVLSAAIDNGGTTLDDLAYLLPDGRAGGNMVSLAVYGREGHPCTRCGEAIQRVVVRGRSTHFCPACQTS